MNSTIDTAEPIVCTLTDEELTVRREEIDESIVHRHREAREIEDGYEIRFDGDAETAERLLAFILGERGCCRFFTFGLHFEPSLGSTWLEIRGSEGTKGLIETMLRR